MSVNHRSAYNQRDTCKYAFLFRNCSYANNHHCFSSKDQCLPKGKKYILDFSIIPYAVVDICVCIICIKTYWRNKRHYPKKSLAATKVIQIGGMAERVVVM